MHSRAEELNELPDHAVFAQHPRHGQYEVRGAGPIGKPSSQANPHDVGHQHRDGITEHGSFGFNSSDAPAQNREPVDHGRMAVSPHHGVRVGNLPSILFADPHNLREMLEVDLVTDAGARRNDPKVVEGSRPPPQEFVALAIALELEINVPREGAVGGKPIDHDGMVDHEIHGCLRIDALDRDIDCPGSVPHCG